MLHASERTVDRDRNPVSKRSPPPEPAAERLLTLQRSAGNHEVTRLVATQRTLARVEVEEVQAECERDASSSAATGPG